MSTIIHWLALAGLGALIFGLIATIALVCVLVWCAPRKREMEQPDEDKDYDYEEEN